MVARIRSGRSIKGAVNYNEKKVSEGKAELIHAKGYTKYYAKLNFHEKLNRLQNLADLNARTSTNCFHVSLNFDPSENLNTEKLRQIAEAYMQGINFEGQPYLVYHHHDAAHQHIHVVSTNIQKDGKRISLHNLGRGLSEKARKEIEVRFGLVRAGEMQQAKMQQLKPVNINKAVYGKDETKHAITNVVNQVISQYKFASLAELNAILQLFNIIADRGAEGTRMFEKNGLQYSLLDKDKKKIGVPIKASSIYGKPTLKSLETKFETGRQVKQSLKSEVKARIKQVLSEANKQNFDSALKNQHIDVVWRTNKDNFIYGVTYVDHHTKSVFNGSDLEKEFSAAAIRASWTVGEAKEHVTVRPPIIAAIANQYFDHRENGIKDQNNLAGILMEPTSSFDYVPYNLKKKRKRKGKKI